MSANTLYPGRPDYEGPRQGILLAGHHDRVAEWTWDAVERVEYVRQHKPKHEVAPRLWQMVMLPQERVPERLARSWAEYCRTWAEHDRFCGERSRTLDEYEYYRAWDEYDRAVDEYNRSLDEREPELLSLLAEYVPDHTWDGERREFVYPEREG